MNETPDRPPSLVTAIDGGTLIDCPCGRVNAVSLGQPYQCPCGWAVLVTAEGEGLAVEAENRRWTV